MKVTSLKLVKLHTIYNQWIISDVAEITKEKLHQLLDDHLQLFQMPGFTEEWFEEQWSALAGDSGAVNKTQLANYLIKYINIFGNTVNIRQEEDKDADGKMIYQEFYEL